MTTRKKPIKKQRVSRTAEYKKDAVKLADTVGVTAAAQQLGLQSSQLYNWRTKFRVEESRSDAEVRLAEENARLKRELAEQRQENDFLKKVSTYFAKHQK